MQKTKTIGTKPVPEFMIRWLLNCAGLYVASQVVSGLKVRDNLIVFLAGGAVLSLVNSLLKPVVTLLSFPFVLTSFGLFMLVINGLMLMIASLIVPGIDVRGGIWTAIVAGVMIGLTNYFLSLMLGVGKK
jgi:putative membrane protein